MLHEIEGVERERSRVSRRPEIEPGVPLLAYFELNVIGDEEIYARRLRAVLGAVYDLAVRADFDEEDLPVDSLPVWFANACRGGSVTEPFSAEGIDAYIGRTGRGPWELHDWLSRFDPDLESRGWEFWDLTCPPGGAERLRLWADTWGEPFFAWEDLRWLVHACGARSVSDPVLAKPEVWAGERSV
jgi:hypothetical protein